MVKAMFPTPFGDIEIDIGLKSSSPKVDPAQALLLRLMQGTGETPLTNLTQEEIHFLEQEKKLNLITYDELTKEGTDMSKLPSFLANYSDMLNRVEVKLYGTNQYLASHVLPNIRMELILSMASTLEYTARLIKRPIVVVNDPTLKGKVEMLAGSAVLVSGIRGSKFEGNGNVKITSWSGYGYPLEVELIPSIGRNIEHKISITMYKDDYESIFNRRLNLGNGQSTRIFERYELS